MEQLSLTTTNSAWWILAYLLIAAGGAWWLYSGKKISGQLSSTRRYTLMGLRFFSLFTLLCLLLGIILENIVKEEKKPIIVFAQDNSASIALTPDSNNVRKNYPVQVSNFIDQFKDKFEVRTLSFGEQTDAGLSLSFNDQQTNLAGLFEWMQSNLFNENIGALIIASDGIINQGADPFLKAAWCRFPVYAVALGDTLLQSDLSIAKADYNKTAYKNTRFPLQISIKGNKVLPGGYHLKIEKNGTVLEEKSVTILNEYSYQKVVFNIQENSTGIQQYTLKLDIPAGDANPLNNTFTIFVDVKADQIKILYLQESWHPDAAAFEQVLSLDPRYQLTIANATDFKGNYLDYSLIILHQLPSARFNMAELMHIAGEKEIPLLFVLGEQTQLPALNQLRVGIEVKQRRPVFDDVYPKLNNTFQLFTIDFDPQFVLGFPPLHVPFGDFRAIPESQVFFFQQVGAIATSKPLVYFTQTAAQKVGFICGEGIWRWRLAEFAKEGNHQVTNEIISKSVQYLCSRDKKERFVISMPDVISEDRDINIDARLYNQSYELINTVDVKFEVTDADGNQYPYLFQPVESGYSLNMGLKARGKYRYIASAALGDEKFAKEGSFIVANSSLEQNQLQANHNLLYQLVSEHDGQMVIPEKMETLVQLIEENKQVASVISSQTGLFELIDLKWIFVLLVLTLTTEWFLRKFWGMI